MSNCSGRFQCLVSRITGDVPGDQFHIYNLCVNRDVACLGTMKARPFKTICLFAILITIGRIGLSDAHDRRKAWSVVPAMWSQNATFQVAFSARFKVHPMSGSALRVGYLFASAGSAQYPRQPDPLMGTGDSGPAPLSLLLAARLFHSDAYGVCQIVPRNRSRLQHQGGSHVLFCCPRAIGNADLSRAALL